MKDEKPLEDLTPAEEAWVWSRVAMTLLVLTALVRLVEWLW